MDKLSSQKETAKIITKESNVKNSKPKEIWHKELSEEDRHIIKEMSQVSLWLDRYNDMFSDFDPRPFSQRSLSNDFLEEAKRASRNKVSGKIELKLLVPQDKRDPKKEPIIKKRLRVHFKNHGNSVQKKINRVIKQGVAFAVIGIILMLIATFMFFEYGDRSFIISFLIVVMEPGGWFFFWEGLGLIIFKSKILKPDLEFNEKMSKCEVIFMSY